MLGLQFAGGGGKAGGAEVVIDGKADRVQFLGGKQLLHGLKELTLFTADVGRKQRGEGGEVALVHFAGGGTVHGTAKRDVLVAERADQRAQFGKTLSGGEQHALLGVEMEADLLVEQAADLSLPIRDVVRGAPALDADAEGEGVLVLAGERMEGRVAEHGNISPQNHCRLLIDE